VAALQHRTWVAQAAAHWPLLLRARWFQCLLVATASAPARGRRLALCHSWPRPMPKAGAFAEGATSRFAAPPALRRHSLTGREHSSLQAALATAEASLLGQRMVQAGAGGAASRSGAPTRATPRRRGRSAAGADDDSVFTADILDADADGMGAVGGESKPWWRRRFSLCPCWECPGCREPARAAARAPAQLRRGSHLAKPSEAPAAGARHSYS